MEMYLNQDYTGEYSGIEYGKKGDNVKVIEDRGIMVFVEKDGFRYHVLKLKLSNDPVTDEVEQIEIKKEEHKITPRTARAGQAKKKPSISTKQHELF